MSLKYRLVREGELFRVVAARDIPAAGVVAGEFGGLVGSRSVLSHDASCWLDYDSFADSDSSITGNSVLISSCLKGSRVSGGSRVEDSTIVNCCVGGGAIVRRSVVSNSRVFDNAIVRYSHVSGGVFGGVEWVSGVS